jgi:hypothetical protein
LNPLHKKFFLDRSQLRRLIPNMGGCYASDRIMVDGLKVGYMYREAPNSEVDSGWRFMAGDETQEYADDPDNWAIYEVNTVCNYDPEIIPHLETSPPCAFARDPNTGRFVEEDFSPPEVPD